MTTRAAYRLALAIGSLLLARPAAGQVTTRYVSLTGGHTAPYMDKLYLGNIDIQRDWGWAENYVVAMYLMLGAGANG